MIKTFQTTSHIHQNTHECDKEVAPHLTEPEDLGRKHTYPIITNSSIRAMLALFA
jgi:hypothetical protein